MTPETQTIAQVIASSPSGAIEAPWHYLAGIPFTQQAYIFYMLTLGSIVGMIGHYISRWASGDIAGSLIDYLFRQEGRRTLLAVIGIVSWSVGEVSTGLFVNSEGIFVGWALVLLSGLKTGYTGDSIANKGTRPVWTPELRAAAAIVKQATVPVDIKHDATDTPKP